MSFRLRVRIALVCSAFLAATALGQRFTTSVAPNCGKYSTIHWGDNTYSCERYATFPWFAAGQGWQSQIFFYVEPVSAVGGVARGAVFTGGLAGKWFTKYISANNFGT